MDLVQHSISKQSRSEHEDADEDEGGEENEMGTGRATSSLMTDE